MLTDSFWLCLGGFQPGGLCLLSRLSFAADPRQQYVLFQLPEFFLRFCGFDLGRLAGASSARVDELLPPNGVFDKLRAAPGTGLDVLHNQGRKTTGWQTETAGKAVLRTCINPAA